MMLRLLRWIPLLLLASGCATAPVRARPSPPPGAPVERGLASVYAPGLAGRPTASGEPYQPSALTCAHRSFPLGSRVEVWVVRTGASAVCRVNDRGPYAKAHLIDLSSGMALRLGVDPKDIARVEIRLIR